MNRKEMICEQLKKLGIAETDTLLVHTSVKGLNEDGLFADEIIEALLETTKKGTLLIPALSYATVTKDNPYFDVNNTRACIGIVAEVFRTKYATNRSVHPTHSVCAAGRLAKSITSAHKLDDTPVGRHSPFRLLESVGGKILMLGCGLGPNTFMHGVEEAAEASYPLAKTPIKYTIVDCGDVHTKSYYPHSFGSLIQHYERLEALLSHDELVKGTVLGGTAFLIDAPAAMAAGTSAIRHNDSYFVD